MRKILCLITVLCLQKALQAQQPYVYTIYADSVKITNDCDTAELIIENHTQNVPGFLFNKGRGRTEFRRALQKISETLYRIGADTLNLSNAWWQGGNSFGATGILGTIDNNHVDIYTNNTRRARFSNAGNLLLGINTDNGYRLQVHGDISLTSGNGDIRSVRFPVLIGDEGGGGGRGILFDGDFTGRSISIGTGHGNTFHKFYIQTAGQPGDTIACYNFTYNSNKGNGLNFYNFADGQTKMLLSGPGNLLLGATGDNGNKLQVYGNVYATGNLHKIGNLIVSSGSGPAPGGTATGIRIDNFDNSSFILQGTSQAWAKDMFVFDDASAVGMDVFMNDQSIIRIKSGFKENNVAGQEASVLNINPNYRLNIATSNPLIIRGVYYHPILTSIPSGSKHIAIETATGDVLLGTTSGNTGIGTSTPTAQLHTTGTVRFGGLTNDNSLTRIMVTDANGNVFYRDASSLASIDLFKSDLAVAGTLSAPKMTITQPGAWPDYVFKPQYKLPSLNDVEQFIQQNSHLPGVPSAAEVEKKGIDVGENQAALLKKIEELTLYIIQQQKEIAELKNQNKDIELLKQQMAELKALIGDQR